LAMLSKATAALGASRGSPWGRFLLGVHSTASAYEMPSLAHAASQATSSPKSAAALGRCKRRWRCSKARSTTRQPPRPRARRGRPPLARAQRPLARPVDHPSARAGRGGGAHLRGLRRRADVGPRPCGLGRELGPLAARPLVAGPRHGRL
jgi:hypothetical protein